MTTDAISNEQAVQQRKQEATNLWYLRQFRTFGAIASVTLFTTILLVAFLSPFAYSVLTSFKDKEQITRSARGPIWPVDQKTMEYTDAETGAVRQLPIHILEVEGEKREVGVISSVRQSAVLVFVDDETQTPFEWEGRLRQLESVWELAPRTGNFAEAWNRINFPLLLRNTVAIAVIGLVGTLLSSICVAYAFARFPLPGKNYLFMILIGTIILPRQVTLVPTYAFFSLIGWTGTWLPLLVPHFFANAYNVFLLRQYFMTIPRELDEAAMIDGAGPFRILISVIIPQSWPVIVAIALFHFVYAWNDYFEPLIYLLGKPELQPISVGIQRFNFQYDAQPHLIQATSLMGLVLPVILFFLAQRFFMRGVVVTGVEK